MQPGHGIRDHKTLKAGGPLLLRFRGTVLTSISVELLFVFAYTTAVVLLYKYVPELRAKLMVFPYTLINILGVVIGLLLVFHTTAAYVRYCEGRQLWSTMTVCVRSMTRGIWLGVKEESGKDVVEKKSVLNLLVAFAVATKHYIREEYSGSYTDLRDLVGHLPVFATPSSFIELQNNPKMFVRTKLDAHDFMPPANIPIVISYYISGYLDDLETRGLVRSYTLTSLNESLGKLVECLTAFERILRTPIPVAFSVHLHHSVWIYILALPFQLVGLLGYSTIGTVYFAAFCLLGIIGIGWKIENPFGKDSNDLPLDDFCEVIRCEIDMITRSRIVKPGQWIHTSNNRPLFPRTQRTAIELAAIPLPELHALIHKSDP